jgi:nicotinate-nucleotide adenylyltransferase
VHYAHLAIAEEVHYALKLTRMLFVPAGQPPHKTEHRITPIHHRLAMLKLAIAPNQHFALSLVDIERAGPSYTVDTLRLLRQQWGECAEMYFVIGGDSLKDLPDWHDPFGILEQATIVALVRPGYTDVTGSHEQLLARLPGLEQRLITLQGPHMDISSTELRQRAAEGRPLRYQMPDAVEHYIRQYNLYQYREELAQQIQEDTHATNAI